MRLRVKLLVFYGAVLGGTLIGLVVLGSVAGGILRKSAERQLLESAVWLAQEGGKNITYKRRQLLALASMERVVDYASDGGDGGEASDAFCRFLKDQVRYEGGRSVYLMDSAGGYAACDEPEKSNPVETCSVLHRLSCVRSALAGEPAIGTTVFCHSTGRPILPFSVPVRRQGGVVGVLWSSVDIGRMEAHMFHSVKIGWAGQGYLAVPAPPERQELCIPDRNPVWEPSPCSVQRALQEAPDGVCHFIDEEGADLLLASSCIPKTSWRVVLARPMSEVLAPVYSLQKIVCMIILVFLGTLFGVTQWLLSPVVRGIEECRRFSERIRAGRLSERLALRSRDEVGELGADLNAMAIALEKNQREKEAARRAEEKLRETKRLLSEAELHMLRFQLNPHFLFNALNSINVLVVHQPKQAQAIILRLADFCRATLLLPDNGLATVRSETELLEQYLAIERMRWEDRLQAELTVESGLVHLNIPVFTLQLLVENAIKYGQLSGADPLRINVRIFSMQEKVCIEVANAGRWFDPEERPGSAGVGLTNLKNRLAAICGAETCLTTEEAEGWVTVRIVLPQPAAAENEMNDE